MELEVAWPRLLRIWWEYLWRSFLTAIGVTLVSAIAGFFAGIVIAAFGGDIQAAKIYMQVLGACIGLASTIIPIGLILGRTFGKFRLALVQVNDT